MGKHASPEPPKDDTLRLTDAKQVMQDVKIIDDSIKKHPLPPPSDDYRPAWR